MKNMEWNKYDWTYCQPDVSGCTKLIKHNNIKSTENFRAFFFWYNL